MSTDATPSWSGYIFQGEVALCRAIEIINTCGVDIPEHYCLRLEQDEDFSIKTDVLEVFQVKAYLSKGVDKLSKYKNVIAKLLQVETLNLNKKKPINIGFSNLCVRVFRIESYGAVI